MDLKYHYTVIAIAACILAFLFFEKYPFRKKKPVEFPKTNMLSDFLDLAIKVEGMKSLRETGYLGNEISNFAINHRKHPEIKEATEMLIKRLGHLRGGLKQ